MAAASSSMRASAIRQVQHRTAIGDLDAALRLIAGGKPDDAAKRISMAQLLLHPDCAEATGALIDDVPAVIDGILKDMLRVGMALRCLNEALAELPADHPALIPKSRAIEDWYEVARGLDFLLALLTLRRG